MGRSCYSTFECHIGDAVSRIRFAPLSNNLLISSWDSSLRLYDVDSGLLRLQAPSGAALLDCCFRDESGAFSAGSDGCIRRYDMHDGTKDILGSHTDIATCVEYCHETCQVISAGLDKKLVCWDIRSAESPVCLNLDMEAESISLSGIDLMVAVGATLTVYDLRKFGSPIQASESLKDVQIKCISSIPCARGYAVGSVDGRVALEILEPSNFEGTGYAFRCHPKEKDGRKHLVSVNDIVFNPIFPSSFASGDNEGYVIMWDAHSKRRLFEFPRYLNSVASLSFNHCGKLLAVALSCTYQETNEMEVQPVILIEDVDDYCTGSSFA